MHTPKKHDFDWIEDFPAAVTVCDTQGVTIAMNRRSIKNFKKWGGENLIGTSLFDCHPDAANQIIRKQLETQQPHVYITRSRSGSKLVQQVPWYKDGVFAGIVETVTAITSEEIPVKTRD